MHEALVSQLIAYRSGNAAVIDLTADEPLGPARSPDQSSAPVIVDLTAEDPAAGPSAAGAMEPSAAGPRESAPRSLGKRPRPEASLESLDLRVLDFGSLDTREAREELRLTGVVGVRLYDRDDPVLLDYVAKLDETAAAVRPDQGTAHGSRGMAGVTKRWGGPSHPNIWEIRLDARVKAVFAKLYGTDDLIVGCDAYAYLCTDAVRASARKLHDDPEKRFHQLTGGSLKPHIDVHPTSERTPGRRVEAGLRTVSPDFSMAVQGQLVLRDVPEGGATLVVAPGEHRRTDPRHFECQATRDFSTCTPDGYSHFDGRWRAVDGVDRGVLLLWASRLPHGNKLANPGVDPERRGLFIAWQPRALVPVAERNALRWVKWNAIRRGGSTDHWATFVPGKDQRGTRGGHYSNKNKQSRVIFSEDVEVDVSDDLKRRILDSL